MTPAREAAYQVLLKYREGRTQLRPILEEVFRKTPSLEPRDRPFCRELVYGTVQRLNTLDWALKGFIRTPGGKPGLSVQNILRLGAYQILFDGGRVPAYAAVNESVELAKKHGHGGIASFVNGVLRSLDRGKAGLPWPDEKADPAEALALRHSHPAWLVKDWLGRWGREETEALLRKNNEPPPLAVRANRLKGTREELMERFRAEGAEAAPLAWGRDGLRFSSSVSLFDLPSFREGLFTVQDGASQLAVEALDPRPGETVLDVCSGLGGKSTHMAERMENRGAVTALDNSAERLALLGENAKRTGAEIIRPLLLDARRAGAEMPESADRVFVDAPCSGLGVIRRRPDLRWNKDAKGIAEAAALQREILDGAAPCVRPGGVLVYAVCTFQPEENERVAEAFLRAHPEFKAAPPEGLAPPGALTPEGFVRLLPHRHDTDGFFIARLDKK